MGPTDTEPNSAVDPAVLERSIGQIAPGLVGRRNDVHAVVNRLRPGHALTVVGPGGVGKTTLVNAVSMLLSDRYDDVWNCELASATDAPSLSAAIADAIGTFRNEDDTIDDAIVSALRGRRALVVLDNVEQVVSAAVALLTRVLHACPDLTVLVTSRVSLRAEFEQQWVLAPLDPLSAPDLFGRRAVEAVADFDPREHTEAIADVCRSLDGLPLALELAAAQLPEMTIGQLRDRLDQRFRTLRDADRSGDGARPDRHATLAATVRWSYDLLDAEHRRLFDRLSVFQRGFDEAGARAVFGADASVHDVGAMLDSLVAASMVTRRTERGATRFELLETLRQFGDRQLAERGERASVRNAHLDHVVDVAATAGARCHGPEWGDGVAELFVDWDNLRAATQWAIDTQRHADVERLLRDVFFMSRWTLESEPSSWAARAADRAGATERDVAAPVHLHLAFAEFLGGRHDGALAENEQALACRATPSDRSWARLYAAIELLYLGRTDDAAKMADVMVTDTPPRAVEQAMQGSAHPVFKMYAGQMDFVEAMDHVHRAALVADATGSPVASGHVEYNRGLLLYARGEVEQATSAFRRVLEIGREHHVPNLVGYVLTSQVSAPGRTGLLAALDALSYWRDHRDVGNEFVVLEGAGINLAELGRLEPAAIILGNLDQDRRRIASSRARREAAMGEISLHRKAGRWVERGGSMSRSELIAYTRDAVESALGSL